MKTAYFALTLAFLIVAGLAFWRGNYYFASYALLVGYIPTLKVMNSAVDRIIELEAKENER
jgi:hypothetical protein